MSVLNDITRAYKTPRAALNNQLSQLAEERTLALVMLFCFLSFIARLPELAMISHLAQDDQLPARAGAMFVSTMFMAPLLLYALAALFHLIFMQFGGQGSYKQARLGLVWAALVCVPLVLLGGVLKVLGVPTLFFVATWLTAVVFLVQWITSVRVIQFPRPNDGPK